MTGGNGVAERESQLGKIGLTGNEEPEPKSEHHENPNLPPASPHRSRHHNHDIGSTARSSTRWNPYEPILIEHDRH
jgi:hypothetical protein